MKPISAKIIARDATRLLSLETLYGQCEVVEFSSDGHPDDALLLGYLDAATAFAEKFTGRTLSIKTLEFALDEFPVGCDPTEWPPAIEIPGPPLIEVLSFTYSDDSDGELEADVDYVVDDYGDKAALRPVSSWPSLTASTPNRIKCRYRAGYQSEEDPDSDAQPLPGDIRAAILLIINHLYDSRALAGDAFQNLPGAVEALLRPNRVLLGMA